jgi:prephenate dehydratase
MRTKDDELCVRTITPWMKEENKETISKMNKNKNWFTVSNHPKSLQQLLIDFNNMLINVPLIKTNPNHEDIGIEGGGVYLS